MRLLNEDSNVLPPSTLPLTDAPERREFPFSPPSLTKLELRRIDKVPGICEELRTMQVEALPRV